MNITIDPDVNISELIDSWINGNIRHVIDILAADHAGLTAVMLMQGLQDRTLTVKDANTIANLLIDRRVMELRK